MSKSVAFLVVLVAFVVSVANGSSTPLSARQVTGRPPQCIDSAYRTCRQEIIAASRYLFGRNVVANLRNADITQVCTSVSELLSCLWSEVSQCGPGDMETFVQSMSHPYMKTPLLAISYACSDVDEFNEHKACLLRGNGTTFADAAPCFDDETTINNSPDPACYRQEVFECVVRAVSEVCSDATGRYVAGFLTIYRQTCDSTESTKRGLLEFIGNPLWK